MGATDNETVVTYSVVHFVLSFLAAVDMKQIQPAQVRYTDVLIPILLSHLVDLALGIPPLRVWHDSMDLWLLALFFASIRVQQHWQDSRAACMLWSMAFGTLVHAGSDRLLLLLGMSPTSWWLYGLTLSFASSMFGILSLGKTTRWSLWGVALLVSLVTQLYLVAVLDWWSTTRRAAQRVVASMAVLWQAAIFIILARSSPALFAPEQLVNVTLATATGNGADKNAIVTATTSTATFDGPRAVRTMTSTDHHTTELTFAFDDTVL